MTSSAATKGFDCQVCQQQHELPHSMAFSMPDFVNKLLPWDKESRCQLSEDWCVVDGKFFYIRGCLEVPINDDTQPFVWGVWSTMSMDDFDATMELWENPQRLNEPEYVGTLANTLPLYAETRGLRVRIRTRAVGERPVFYIDDSAHQLFAEQERGMPRATAITLAQTVLHGSSSNPWGYLCDSQP